MSMSDVLTNRPGELPVAFAEKPKVISRTTTRKITKYRDCLLPRGAIDTHVHVFDPRLGPYSPTRAYTPGNAPYSDLVTFSKTISATGQPAQFVLVQPSPYGTDNTVLLRILNQCQRDGVTSRGIAVVDLDTVTPDTLSEMHDVGVRGLRLNMQASGHGVDVEALKTTLGKAAAWISHLPGWKIQIFAPGYVWEKLEPTILDLPVKVIADHTGGLSAPSKLTDVYRHDPVSQPGFAALVRLAKAGKVLVKISGLYRSSNATDTDFADMENIVRELGRQVPDALIWGSDWPHTGEGKNRLDKKLDDVEPFRLIENIAILAHIRAWLEEDVWTKMMVGNAQRAFA